jgi:histidine triad (HIT) family protein
MAMPLEHVESTEELEHTDRQRFLELVDFAISATKELAPDYPQLTRGFSIKVHFGSFETIPHAKLHILNVE